MGKTRHSFEDVAEDEGFVVGVSEEGKETKFSECGKGDGRHIDADRLRGGKNGAKVVVDYVDGGEVGAGGDNRVEEGIDGSWREGRLCWSLHHTLRLSCLRL